MLCTFKMTNDQWQQLFSVKPTKIQLLDSYAGVDIMVKRDDTNHQIVQGNKLRKLKYNLKYALENNYTHIATFGGAYSNHLLATAQAAQFLGVKPLGFIRGDELESNPAKWSTTLQQVQQLGMQLVFLTRKEYRLKQNSANVEKYMTSKTYVIPEGGSNKLALRGVAEIIDELKIQIKQPSHIICACGTGGTLAGLIDGVAQNNWQTKVVGIPVLKGAEFLIEDISQLSKSHAQVNWQLYLDYHAGGYGKINKQTSDFAKNFSRENSISLDKIYTAKAFYAAYDLINKGEINKGSSIVILHTGGLQGGLV